MAEKPVVIVTGASRGLGEACARWLASKECRLVVTARNAEGLRALRSELEERGAEVLEVAGDVAESGACSGLVQKTLERFGRIDSLVNNAGVLAPVRQLAAADPAEWAYNVAVNLLGPAYLMQAALPSLRQSMGRIINVSTGAAVQAIEGWSAYCASKAGLLHLSKVVSAEEKAVTVVSLRPGVIDTGMQELIRRDGPGHMPAQMADYFQQLKTTGQLEPPAVPGRALAWLALFAPRGLNGEFLDYNDPRVQEPARREFGEGF
ncbi:MAG: SDR family NAD(P)-dependent oxidoreductase [Armatimonadetes bacterium]|nr:SDR family NAD(P)-dependent oxidoreductase [Armatimonadota bacterium]